MMFCATESDMQKRYVKYEISLVTHTDILGFGDLVNTQTAGHISKTLRVFREAIGPPQYKRAVPRIPAEYVVNFSDLCIMSRPLRSTAKDPPTGACFFSCSISCMLKLR